MAAALELIDLAGPRDTCTPSCPKFVAKWHDWFDASFVTTPPATIPIHELRDDAKPYIGDLNYRQAIGGKSRNMLMKAAQCGFTFATFDRNDEVEAIYTINRSKRVRSGGPMRDAYMHPPPLIGPLPELCDRHQLVSVGAYLADELRAYCHLAIVNELAVVNSILAHGDSMPGGLMNALIADVVHRLLREPHVRHLNYLTLNCPAGLARFKRSVGFEQHPLERTI